jgi:hypothetical protein
VRLFRRREEEPADPNERSPELGLKFKDLAVLGQLIDAGADFEALARRHGAEYDGWEASL